MSRAGMLTKIHQFPWNASHCLHSSLITSNVSHKTKPSRADAIGYGLNGSSAKYGCLHSLTPAHFQDSQPHSWQTHVESTKLNWTMSTMSYNVRTTLWLTCIITPGLVYSQKRINDFCSSADPSELCGSNVLCALGYKTQVLGCLKQRCSQKSFI